MSTVPDLQPDELEVLQAEDPGYMPAARVEICGSDVPLRVQNLPRKAGATMQFPAVPTVAASNGATRILRADHRRASAQVVSIGQNMLIAYSAAAGQDASRMALWPANVPFTMNTDGDLYVASATSTTVISVVTELWATGE